MDDMVRELDAVHRETGDRSTRAGQARTVVLRREYDAPIDDVWDAITNPSRIKRWFLPVSGDLRLGGTYQLQGNAGGEIIRCEPPRVLAVTWVFGEKASEDDISEVEVRLTSGGSGGTTLELEHLATVDPERWAKYGPGAVGVGWDLTLLGLSLHLRGESIGDPEVWETTPEARDLLTWSSTAWGAALRAAGASSGEVATAVENTTKFYVPERSSRGDESEAD